MPLDLSFLPVPVHTILEPRWLTDDGQIIVSELGIDGATFLLTPIVECPGDATGDRRVDIDDLEAILGAWDTTVPIGSGPDIADFDGHVGVNDLNAVLGAWGDICE